MMKSQNDQFKELYPKNHPLNVVHLRQILRKFVRLLSIRGAFDRSKLAEALDIVKDCKVENDFVALLSVAESSLRRREKLNYEESVLFILKKILTVPEMAEQIIDKKTEDMKRMIGFEKQEKALVERIRESGDGSPRHTNNPPKAEMERRVKSARRVVKRMKAEETRRSRSKEELKGQN